MKKFLSVFLLVALIITTCPAVFSSTIASAEIANEKTTCIDGGEHNYTRKINSVAHRGYSMGAPENTLPAYTMAKEKGFYYAECDVSYSSDGVPVLMHLRDISHTSNGSGNVDQLTFSQLRKYDYGSWKGSQFKGTKIPTFEEFIAHCAELDIHPYIELKDHGNFNQQKIQELVNIVKKYGMLRQCTWITFIHDYCYYINNCDPYARLGFLWPNDVNQNIINKALSYKTSNNQVFLDIQYTSLTENGIELAKKNGLPIEVYTINDKTTLLNIEDYISGFTTDGLHADTVFDEPIGLITDPTCTEAGYTTYVCTDCGYKNVTDYVDALGHEYDENGECWRCVLSTKSPIYYVAQGGSDNNNGLSSSKPLATVNKAVQLALLRGAGKDDVVTVNVSGTVKFGAASIKSHEFTLKLTALNSNATLTSADSLALGGPTIFDKVAIDMGSDWKYFAFGGNSVTFDGRFTHDWVDVELGRGSAELNVTEEVNININSFIRKFGLGNTWYSVTYNENCNINFNGTNGNPNAEFIINLGAMQDLGSTNFNKALNITNERVEKFAFTKGSGLEFGADGYFNFINNATGTTIDNHSFGFSSSQLNKTWVLNNKSTLSKVTPTDKKGYFAVEKGYIAIAKKPGASAVLSNEDGLHLSAGQYDIDFVECKNHFYSDDFDINCNNCGLERKTYQSEIDKCTIYPTLASGTVNGNIGVHNLTNCVGPHATRLYTVNTYKVEEIKEVIVGEESRIFVQFFDSDGNYIGGSGWQTKGIYKLMELGCAAKATYFKVTFSGTKGGDDLSTPDAKNLFFVLPHKYDNDCDNSCNVCNELRQVGNHQYAHDTDKDCDICGYIRDVESDALIKENGVWYYYKNGVKSDQTTLVKYSGKWFYVVDGIWDAKITNTLVKYEGKWFYIKGGKWNSNLEEGLYKYNGVYFWIKSGKWNSKIEDGLYKYSGKWFYIKDGKWASTKKGIIKYEGKNFYVSGGKWDSSKTTLYNKEGKLFAIKSGKWYKGKSIIKYNGKKYYVNDGYAKTNCSGKTTINGTKYTVKKGIIQ